MESVLQSRDFRQDAPELGYSLWRDICVGDRLFLESIARRENDAETHRLVATPVERRYAYLMVEYRVITRD